MLQSRLQGTLCPCRHVWYQKCSSVSFAILFQAAAGRIATPPPTCVHSQVPELKAAGVDKVVCVTVGDPEQVSKWAKDNGFDKDMVSRLAWTRGR